MRAQETGWIPSIGVSEEYFACILFVINRRNTIVGRVVELADSMTTCTVGTRRRGQCGHPVDGRPGRCSEFAFAELSCEGRIG
jgi:hypothetical protein